jgi:transposase
MEILSLTADEKHALEERHKHCRDKRESDRIKAVLLANEDWSSKLIAQALRKHEASIKRYLTDYCQSQKLTENRGGSEGYLNEKQTQQLIAHLCGHLYFHQHEIVAHIKQRYNVSYTLSGLNKWLHQHNFSCKN